MLKWSLSDSSGSIEEAIFRFKYKLHASQSISMLSRVAPFLCYMAKPNTHVSLGLSNGHVAKQQ